MQNDIYNDIATRTNGDIYIGVVGPVRTGKSTFIKRFIEKLVLPLIKDKQLKTRMLDELPQSADGKTIMTTEPKFVPETGISLKFDKTNARIRLIDCVGYLVKDALGHMEGERARMVKTPWTDKEIPFDEAGEIGTVKVIRDHSTIGVLVTTDGTITDLPRASYLEAEEKAVAELKSIDKPFIIVLNSRTPNAVDTQLLRTSLEEKYNVSVVCCDVEGATENDFTGILSGILLEFPVKRVDLVMQKWMRTLSASSETISAIMSRLSGIRDVAKLKDYKKIEEAFESTGLTEDNPDLNVDGARGVVKVILKPLEGLFYRALSAFSGTEVDDDFKLMSYVKRLAACEKDYEGIRNAMSEVDETGYGIIVPSAENIELKEPEIQKKGARFGVKLRANAPSYHILKVDVETEMSPAIGDSQQSEDVAQYLLTEYENDKTKLWDASMFGKSLATLIKEDLSSKIGNMPQDAKQKMKKTVTRIVNEGRGGVLCILL